jgi:peroxiredoxin
LYGEIAAPEMTLAYLDGSRAQLSDLKGKVVLLNFWATWCPPCREELPHFEALYQAYGDQGLAVVGVSMDQAGDEYVRKFSEEIGITYPIAIGSFEEMEKIWGKIESIPTVHGFGGEKPAKSNGSVQMMPTTFVIDREGRIYRKHVGPRDRETLEPELRFLMGMEDPLAKSS